MELSLRASLEARVEGQGSVVVPGRLLVELARLLPDTEVSIEQRADEGVIHIRSGSFESRLNTYTAEDFPRLPDAEGLERHGVDGIWLTTRRIDGQFPNYKQLIPECFEYEVPLPRDEVLDVVRRIAVMAQRNSPLRLRFAEGELTVSARTQDVGEAQESLPVS